MPTSYNLFRQEDCLHMETVDDQCILHMRATSHHPAGILVLPPLDPRFCSVPLVLFGNDYDRNGTFIPLPGAPEPHAQRTPEELAELLEHIARIIRCRDSYEGSITWTFGETPGALSVAMAVRSGNLQGQGGVCIL